MRDLSKFGKVIKLKSFVPFKSAAHALENINDITEGIVNDFLKNFLEANMPTAKPGKKSKAQLGVFDAKLGGAVQDAVGISCVSNDVTDELIRGIRTHFSKLIKQFKGALSLARSLTEAHAGMLIGLFPEGDIERAQLGLGHAYSRAKVKFNVNRVDNMIIQAIALLDQMDKDLNTFAMRVRYAPPLSRFARAPDD